MSFSSLTFSHLFTFESIIFLMVKLLILLAVLMAPISSCKLTESNITGQYKNYLNFEYSKFLQLDHEHNYYFSQYISVFFFESRGNWRIKSDTLFSVNRDTSNGFWLCVRCGVESTKVQI